MSNNYFTLPLQGEFLGNYRWKLLAPFEYYLDEPGGEKVVVPINFITDGLSIPKFALTIIGGHWDGQAPQAAVIHDFLYQDQRYTRKKTDQIFLESMKILGVSWWKRRTMWLAVRIAASGVWSKYRKAEGT